MPDDRALITDETAASADPALPAFLARPNGAPVYHGFVIVPETYTDGWCLGAITEFEDPNGCEGGDAFVVAPDGSRAGLVWEVGAGDIQEILEPSPERWGVYAVWFPRPTRTIEDLVVGFRAVLPQLKSTYERIKGNVG